jgi:hypothetical protein
VESSYPLNFLAELERRARRYSCQFIRDSPRETVASEACGGGVQAGASRSDSSVSELPGLGSIGDGDRMKGQKILLMSCGLSRAHYAVCVFARKVCRTTQGSSSDGDRGT